MFEKSNCCFLCRLNQQSVMFEGVYTCQCGYMFSDREFNSDVGFKGVWHRGLRAVLRLHAFNLLSHQYCEVPGIVGFKEDWKRPDGTRTRTGMR